MYPVHHPTLKIEQAERQADAARLRLAATAGGARRRWWSWRPRLTTAPGSTGPAPMPSTPASAPVPAANVVDGDDRVLVGR